LELIIDNWFNRLPPDEAGLLEGVEETADSLFADALDKGFSLFAVLLSEPDKIYRSPITTTNKTMIINEKSIGTSGK